ncbi:hypothetical protein RFUL19S_01197 [Rhizobacter fulvus]
MGRMGLMGRIGRMGRMGAIVPLGDSPWNQATGLPRASRSESP